MKYTIIILLSLLGLASCDNKSPEGQSDGIEQEVTSISVSCQQRKAAPGIETKGNDGDKDDEFILINSFDDSSLLYFSQMGPTTGPNFDDTSDTASPYLYIYQYNKNEADWDNDYNFSVQPGRQTLNWATVKEIGSVGNAFSMYAFYFPVENKQRFNVEANQTQKEDFMKSDIMGAYHATSSLYTRLRFRLFHLMVYLKVALYVPVYQDEKSEGNNGMSLSGFKAGAMRGAYVMNANTGFSIEWRANRSSDTDAPLTQASGNKTKITMYAHTPDESNIIEGFEVKDYYRDESLETDRVRRYDFSVLFPAQSFGDNFLCFELQDVNDAMKYYYFSGNQIVGDTGNYGLTQGTLQELHLYLPRTTNQAILVGAKILPWQDAVTDMTVTKDKKENDQN